MEELFGRISGFLVFISVLPYAWRIYQRKTTPNLMTWVIWSFLGLALLLTYKSQGAGENIWPAIFGFTNPVIVTICILWRADFSKKISFIDIACFVIAGISFTIWLFVKENKIYSAYANYVAIFADFCAVIPSLLYYWKSPQNDRPLAWVLFGIGYGIGILAIKDGKVSDYVLPIYMSVMTIIIAVPLILYRIRMSSPLKEWI